VKAEEIERQIFLSLYNWKTATLNPIQSKVTRPLTTNLADRPIDQPEFTLNLIYKSNYRKKLISTLFDRTPDAGQSNWDAVDQEDTSPEVNL